MLSNSENNIQWLLQGDPAIRWQTLRDLTDADAQTIEIERRQVAVEGWGARLLARQDKSGMWSNALYSPKWTSTTYTLLALCRLGLPSDNVQAQKACYILLDKGFYPDGGINFWRSYKRSETCVTGMILLIQCHFHIQDDRLDAMVQHLLSQRMPDDGWNCLSYRGATHSSFHTTISVLEGLRAYEKLRQEKQNSIIQSRNKAHEFLLKHKLFRSHRTGNIVDEKMTRFAFPPRWRYDIMRVLDYFQECDAPYDNRMDNAIDLIYKRCDADGRWPLQNRHAGKVFYEMEQVGKPSRMNTLRAMRILKWLDREKNKLSK